MNPQVAVRVWHYLGDRKAAVRADPHLGPVFEALAAGDARALQAGRAARTFAGCSRATLARRCLKRLGLGYAHFVMGFRLTEAHRLLHEEALPVAAVADLTGFGDAAVLRHAFRRRFGTAPRGALPSRGDRGPSRRSSASPPRRAAARNPGG